MLSHIRCLQLAITHAPPSRIEHVAFQTPRVKIPRLLYKPPISFFLRRSMELETTVAGGDLPAISGTFLALLSAIPLPYYLTFLTVLLSVALYDFLELHFLRDLVGGLRGGKVKLTFHPDSEIYRGVAAKCRALHGRYLATPWLASPHFQTAFLNFFGNPPRFRYRRQIFNVLDGGTIALDWLLSSDVVGCSSDTDNSISTDDTTPIVIVVPGLTSDSNSPYMKHIVYKIAQHGWNVVVSNHRGLGGMSITSDCFYNAGWTEDVRLVIKHLHQQYPHAPLFAIGTSIGANVLVKYLGEEGENTPVAGAASICSPWDLVVCDRFINRKLIQRLYDRALTIGLKGYAQLHEPVLSRLADWEGIRRSRSVRDFDNYATCLVAKYETVDTYYRRCSSVSYLGNVSVPLLCVSALDDPVCTKEAIPLDECRANKNIVLATTDHGGHLGFFQGIFAKSLWWVGAVEEFLKVLHAGPHMHVQKMVPTSSLHSSLESNIDKAPYVNVVEDGMLSAVSNGNPIIDNLEGSSDDPISSEQPVGNPEAEIFQEVQPKVPTSSDAVQQCPPPSEATADKEKNTSDFHQLVSPLKKTLNQLSRNTSKSIWLLAYVAIMTSWPLVGPALLIAIRKKLKNFLPAALRGR